ncbi:MAG TPA: prepilin-type N-terminal cleavage/methylation domain-containing protein [Candidatus Omnitrophota bacterium]|nr:prepilin-type N-terminal cleavage/methylation domain-containing protein [Candidatus Omnitrophota bacterium]HQL42083.1 prepilin-type N-terminal cleavage/methylation domain-containing protein [Candidatus Omnitrophota bacterium]
MKDLKEKEAFTFIEIMLVAIIIGILAGFGVPQYFKTVQKAKQRDVTAIIHLIKGAQEMYHNKKGVYYPQNTSSVAIADINQNLNLDILQPSDIVYQCTGTGGSGFLCKGCHPSLINGRWCVETTEVSNPACVQGTGLCY